MRRNGKTTRYIAQLGTSANIITDKTPANFQYIGIIFSIFPDAKIIHLKRDPRAICWSIYKSKWTEMAMDFLTIWMI